MRRLRFALPMVCLAIVACDGTGGTSSNEVLNETSTLLSDGSMLCGYEAWTNEDGTQGTFPVIYNFDKINERIASDVGFAARLEFNRVEDCDDARAAVALMIEDEDAPASEVGTIATETELVNKVHVGTAVNGAGANQQWEGIVQISIGSSGCTAFFITHRHLVTAAHCVGSNGSKTVAYRAPTLSSGAWQFSTATVTKHPDWQSGSRSTDIAVISLANGEAWANSSRRFRLFTGSTSLVTLQIYGYGANVYAGTGSGTLRVGRDRTTIHMSRHQDGYFAANAHTARACKGDSGGPAIREGSQPIVWGIASQFKTAHNDACPHSDEEMFWAKLNTNISFVESVLGFPCPRFTADGQSYARCW